MITQEIITKVINLWDPIDLFSYAPRMNIAEKSMISKI